MAKQTDAKTAFNAEPPRQEVSIYGEPVAKEQIGGEYWEAYSPDNHEIIFVAHYCWNGAEWVKQGLDRHRVSELFNTDGWPTN